MTKQAYIDKIIALQARTKNANCSEAEVEAAMKTAIKLMAKHGISEKELVAKGHTAIIQLILFGGKARLDPIIENVVGAVQSLTDVSVLFRGGEIEIIGTELDVKIAEYLFNLILNSAQQAWYTYKDKEYGTIKNRTLGTHLRKSYVYGYVKRVKSILMVEIIAKAEAEKTSATGTSLVIVKKDMIDEFISELYGELRSRKPRKTVYIDQYTFDKGNDAAKDFEIKEGLEEATDNT